MIDDAKVEAMIAQQIRGRVVSQRRLIERIPGWHEHVRLSALHALDRLWNVNEQDGEYPRFKRELEDRIWVREENIPGLVGVLSAMLARETDDARRKQLKDAIRQATEGRLARGYDLWIAKDTERRETQEKG